MDLALYARVIWRFRLIVLAGLLLAVVLALLSYVHVSLKGGSPSLTYRQAELWQSDTRILIRPPGFPQGRAVVPLSSIPGSSAVGPSTSTGAEVVATDLSRLAVYFAGLANGDAVQRILARNKSLRGAMTASPYIDPATKSPQPVLILSGVASTPEMASRVAAKAAVAFRRYFNRLATNAKINPEDRVQLSVLNQPSGAQLIAKRKKTVPIFVFLTVMIAAVGLAFVLENLRPRMRLVESRRDEERPRRRDSA